MQADHFDIKQFTVFFPKFYNCLWIFVLILILCCNPVFPAAHMCKCVHVSSSFNCKLEQVCDQRSIRAAVRSVFSWLVVSPRGCVVGACDLFVSACECHRSASLCSHDRQEALVLVLWGVTCGCCSWKMKRTIICMLQNDRPVRQGNSYISGV